MVYARPVFELRCGITTLREKITRLYPEARLSVLCREHLASGLKQKTKIETINELSNLSDDGCLFLKGSGPFLSTDKIPVEGNDEVFMSNGV